MANSKNASTREFAEKNPGVQKELREYFAYINTLVSWPVVTTTTTVGGDARDFSIYPVGTGNPTGWSAYWNTSDVTGAIVSDPYDLGGKDLQLTHTADNRFMIGPDELINSTDVQILSKIKTNSNNNDVMAIHVRASGAVGAESGYHVRLNPTNNTIELYQWNPDQLLKTVQGREVKVDTWYWVRFQIQSGAIKVKGWEDGFAEPPWEIEIHDLTHTSGNAGFGCFTGISHCDYFAYETDTLLWPIESPIETPVSGYELNQADAQKSDGHAPSVEISEDHKTASPSKVVADGARAVRSLGSKSSGKWYYEVNIDLMPADNCSLGWMDGNHGLLRIIGAASGYIGVGYWSGGRIYHDGTFFNLTSFSAVTGDYIQFAIDFATGKIWVGKNGTWYNSGDPGAGTGETYLETEIIGATLFPAVQVYDKDAPNTLTIRLNTSEFEGTLPTGFSALEDAPTTTTT